MEMQWIKIKASFHKKGKDKWTSKFSDVEQQRDEIELQTVCEAISNFTFIIFFGFNFLLLPYLNLTWD